MSGLLFHRLTQLYTDCVSKLPGALWSTAEERQKVIFVPDSRASIHYPALLASGVPSEDHKLLLHPAILSKTA